MMGGSIAIGLVLVKISGSIIEKKKLNNIFLKKARYSSSYLVPKPEYST